MVHVYMLCFQYRTDCLQYLPLQVCEWCMCLHALLFSTGQVEQCLQFCHVALQLNQVISPCETSCWLSCIPTHTSTPNARWPEGKDTQGHCSTRSFFIHIPAREVFHYMQVIAACGYMLSFQYSTS